jgi:hypothetical protein
MRPARRDLENNVFDISRLTFIEVHATLVDDSTPPRARSPGTATDMPGTELTVPRSPKPFDARSAP